MRGSLTALKMTADPVPQWEKFAALEANEEDFLGAGSFVHPHLPPRISCDLMGFEIPLEIRN